MKKTQTHLLVLSLVMIFCIACLNHNKVTTKIFYNPDGTSRVIQTYYGIKSIKSEQDKEGVVVSDFKDLMDIFQEQQKDQKTGVEPVKLELWKESDGSLTGKAESLYDKNALVKEFDITVDAQKISVKIWLGSTDISNIVTDGKKTVKDQYVIISWPVDTKILEWTKVYPEVQQAPDNLTELFDKEVPKGRKTKVF